MTNKNLLQCVIKSWKDQEFRMNKVDPATPSNVTKHINHLYAQWRRVNSRLHIDPNVAASTTQYFERLKRAGNIAGAISYDPKFYKKMQTRAALLPEWLDRVSGGNANDYIHRLTRHSKGYIQQVIADNEVAQKARTLGIKINKVVKEHGITEADRAVLAYKMVEISSQPYLIQYSGGANAASQMLLKRRADDAWNWYKELGMTEPEIKDLIETATTLMQAEHEVINVFSQLGGDLTPIFKGGYFPRVLNNEAKRLFKHLDHTDELVDDIFPISISVKKWFKQSQQSDILVPSDIETIDYLFKNSGVFDRINNTTNKDLAAYLDGTEIKSIKELLGTGNDPILNEMFLNQLTSGELDFMFETGLLQKIPMDTPTLWEHLSKHYQLPFDGLSDLFNYNPESAFKAYNEHLIKLAADTGKVWGLIDGAENGFGVPRQALDPEIHKGFVSLKNALPVSVVAKISGNNENLLNRLDDLYIHPNIARAYKGTTELLISPYYSGLLGDALQTLRRTTQGMMLTTIQWLGRNVIGNAGMLHGYGVNIHNYLGHLTKMGAMQAWDNLHGRVFNYKKYLNDPKLKELWDLGVRKGQLSDWSIGGRQVDELRISKKGFERTFKEMEWLRKEYPDHFGSWLLKTGIDSVDAVINEPMYKYLGWGNNLTDNAAKFSFVEQLMSNKRFTRRVGLDTLPTFTDPKKAWDYVTQHFYQFDDIPHGQPLWDAASSMQPFLSWQLKNMQQTGRFIIENPGRFGVYLKLANQMNMRFNQEHAEERQLMNSDWVKDEDFIIPYVIPEELSGTGKPEYFNYSWSNLMPMFGALDSATDVLDFFGVFNNNRPPSNRPDNPFVERDNKWRQIIKNSRVSLASEVLAPIEILARFNEDNKSNPFGFESKRDIMGIPVSRKMYHALTTLIPNVRTLDKAFGFTGLAGEAPELNEKTGEWNPGKPSWTGTVPQYKKGSQQPNMFGSFTPVMQFIGLNPNYIDMYEQMGYKMSEIDQMRYEAKSQLKYFITARAKARDKEQLAKIIEKHQDALTYAYMLELEWIILQTWRKKEGIPSNRALRLIRSRNIQRITHLLPEKEVERIAKEVYEDFNNRYINKWEDVN